MLTREVTEDDIIRNYELIASSIYELISEEKVGDFEKRNRPILK